MEMLQVKISNYKALVHIESGHVREGRGWLSHF